MRRLKHKGQLHRGRSGSATLLGIVLPYAIFASLWILLSDRAVALIFTVPSQVVFASTVKGWFFVIVTSALLYLLVRRLHGMEPGQANLGRELRPLLRPLLLWGLTLLLLAAAGSALVYRQVRIRAETRIQAVASLKAGQLGDWIKERMGDALYLQGSPVWADALLRVAGQDAWGREHLAERLNDFRRSKGFHEVLLLDPAGRPLWRSSTSTGLPGVLQTAVQRVQNGSAPTLLGPYHDQDGQAHLDLIAPLQGDGVRLVLSLDPAEYLDRALQTWPVPTRTGEMVLFRRQQDQIHYLTRIRTEGETALNLTRSMADRGLLAQQALQDPGSAGRVLDGVDYRGVAALGVSRPIPGTDWHVMVKMDRSELLGEASGGFLWIVLAALLGFLGAASMLLLSRKRRQLALAQRQGEIQAEKLRAMRLLDLIASGSSDAIFAKDIQGRYTFFNAEVCRRAERSAQEISGATDEELFPGQADAITANDRTVMTSGRTLTFMEERFLPTGTVIYQSIKGPIRDADGTVTGLFGISRDITSLKQTEQALRSSEERLRLALASSRMGVWEWNIQANTIYWSPECFEIVKTKTFGGTIEAFAQIVHPDDLEKANAAIREALEGRRQYYSEFRVKGPGGEDLWLGNTGKASYDAEGNPISLVGVVQDITERRMAEELLRERDNLLLEMSERFHMGGWSFDTATGKGTWTEEVARIHEVDPAAATNTEFGLSFYPPADRARLERAIQEAIDHAEPFDLELELNTAKGNRRLVRTIGYPQLRDGKVVILRGSFQDITSLRRAEEERTKLQSELQQAQKMESIGRLAGGVAHDFNNMLGVIIGHTELAMLRAGEESPVTGDLEEIQKAAQRSADLTRQLLAFARRQTVSPKLLDLNAIVSGMLKMLGRLIGEDITLSWTRKEGLWRVRMDPAQVDQILANLAVNARDAVGGGGSLAIATCNLTVDAAFCARHPEARPGDYVVLSVQDDGCGMTAEVLQHIFEPFFTTKAMGKGTGLGLATVYGIVRQNDGFLTVESEPGKGTCFRIHLPRFEDDGNLETEENDPSVPQGRGERVLLVEDETANLSVFEVLLRLLGYEVLAAPSPAAALELAQGTEGPIDLLITDVVMPGMDGHELAERVRALRPGLRCLYMSGYTADVIAHHGILDQGVHFIQKPFSRPELALKVREALDAPEA